MSKFTMQLRFAVLNAIEKHNIPVSDAWETDLEQYWHYAYKYLGLEDYPIFDEGYREELNAQIIRHYYFQEIGCETLAQFSFRMRAHMWEVMPYYNRLYVAALQLDEKDIWSTADRSYTEHVAHDEDTAQDERYSQDDTTTTHDTGNVSRETTSDTETGGTSSDETRTDVLDLPMGTLGSTNDLFASGEYATNRERVVSNGSTTGETSTSAEESSNTTSSGTGTLDRDGTRNSTGTRTFTEDRSRTYRERDLSYAELFKKYADAIMDIDAMVVESCDDLFMAIY